MNAENQTNGRMANAVNSTLAVFIARFIVPALMLVVGSLGTFVLNNLLHSINGIEDTEKKQWEALGATNKEVNSVRDQATGAKNALDAAKQYQDEIVGQLRSELGDHETRIRTLERPTVSLPPAPSIPMRR